MPRFTRYLTLKPERDLTIPIARATRLTKLAEKEPRFRDIPNFEARLSALSQAAKSNQKLLSRRLVNDQKSFGHTAALIAAGLSRISTNDLSKPSKREQYRALRTAQIAHRELTSRKVSANVSPTGGDRRRYNPTGKSVAHTLYGTVARMMMPDVGWVRAFANPRQVIPCVQRSVRRQVMFAKHKAGKGYRSPKRRTWSSGVPC